MKPNQLPGASSLYGSCERTSDSAVQTATLKRDPLSPSMRFIFIRSAPMPSLPQKITMTYRGGHIELGHGPIHFGHRKPCHHEYPSSHSKSPPPPPPKELLAAPDLPSKDPRWPPGDVNRRVLNEERKGEATERPPTDDPSGEALPTPGNPALPKPVEPGKDGKLLLPDDVPDLPWPELMPNISQPYTLPPLVRRFFMFAPEPQLLQTLELMFEQGLEPMARDEMGNSLLMLAAATGKPALVKLLIERFPALMNSLLNRFGENAASLAKAYCPEALPMLLEAGMELHPQNPALQWYLNQSNSPQSAESRLQELATILSQDNYVNLRDDTGKTLLFHAVIRGDVDVTRFLCNLAAGPAVVWRDAAGKSLFAHATEIADVELGAIICAELKELRRRNRPMYKRTIDRF